MNIGASAWPRLDSGRLDIDGDAFRLMYHIPGVADLHALRDSLRVVVTAKLPIGRDGRNRPSMFPFGTATGRNAHCKSLFNAHAGMRSFMYASPGKIMVYLDWRTQEVGVAAGLSGDQALMEAYRSGDVYHRLALNAGITTDLDPKHWAKHNTIERQRMKSLQLGVNYGMGVPSLAKGLNRHPLVASHLIEMYRRKYKVFWEWRDNQAVQAKLDRRIETVFGWPLHISTSPNQRTLFNFPMQGGGGEMLRLASVRLCEAGVVPCMLVHDGILFEVDNREQIEVAREIMRKAGQDTCNGLEIGADVDQLLENGAHFRDKRKTALRMWERMMETLQRVGAIRRSA
jgi:DNA polymerase I